MPAPLGNLSLSSLTADRDLLCRPSALTPSIWRNRLNACEPPEAPDAPTQPELTLADSQITADWDTPDPNNASITGYNIRYRAGPSSTWKTWAHTSTQTFTTITGLTNNTVYHIQVAATNSGGTGGWSPPAAEQANTPVGASELDRQALIAFHKSTDGPTWGPNWIPSNGRFPYSYVSTDSNGRVTRLNVNYKRSVKGAIPEELGNLTQLKTLYLHKNSLSGEIPDTLGNLAQLQTLYLYDNSLSGEIPDTLGNLAQLKNLRLYGNSLSGEIPDTLGGLAKLRYLELHGNSLSGEIPSELGNLANLYYLELHDNNLSGAVPSELGSLSNLNSLKLGGNHLTGPVPASMSNLKLPLRKETRTSPWPPYKRYDYYYYRFSADRGMLCRPARSGEATVETVE